MRDPLKNTSYNTKHLLKKIIASLPPPQLNRACTTPDTSAVWAPGVIKNADEIPMDVLKTDDKPESNPSLPRSR